MVLTRQCGDSSTLRGNVLAFGAELLCGIGSDENRSVLRTGCEHDTSPLGGLLWSTARFACGNLLKSRNMNGKTRLAARFFVTPG